MDWERRYAEGDTPWDKGTAHPALEDWLARGTLTGQVLVPGCGVGHDVRALTRHGLEVVGLDVAQGALERAKSFQPAGGEIYHRGDVFHLPAAWHGTFNGVLEHTCFCAIEPKYREDYVRSIASVLKLGGRLLAVFYKDMEEQDGEPPFGVTPEELDALFLGQFRILEEDPDPPTFPGREGCELVRLLTRI